MIFLPNENCPCFYFSSFSHPAASRSASSRIRAASSPSTITRISGSVPLARIRILPVSPSRSSHSSISASISGLSCRASFMSRSASTFSSTCGVTGILPASTLSGSPVSFITRISWMAESSPSPVGIYSRKMICPDCSPPML